MRVAISFDYDSPAGYRESFGKQHYDPRADYDGAEALLTVLRSHQVRATFAVVGCVARDGDIPEQCPDQIRRIAAEHEVASHSMYHKFIPAMKDQELLADTRASKEALEACIGGQVRGFIPPFNRPVHFPQKLAFSPSERLGLQGRGRGRQSLGNLLGTLSDVGFGWCRVSYKNSLQALAEKMGARANGIEGRQPFLYGDIVAVPLHATGFTESAIRLVRSHLDSAVLAVLYAHPNQALRDPQHDSESAENLDRFLTLFQSERAQGRLTFETMAEVESTARATASRA